MPRVFGRSDRSVPWPDDGRTAAPIDADAGIAFLYDAHWERLVRIAWLIVRDQALAEDAVQDAFVATHRGWSRIRDTGAAVAYLQRSVINNCRSAQRRSVVADRYLSVVKHDPGTPGVSTHESAEQTAMRRESADRMLDLLAQLPQRQREVLVLRYYADLSEAQIAQALEIAPGSVKAHAHRAMAALRGLVDATQEKP